MTRTLIAAALAALVALPAAADGEYAAGSQVKGWDNLQGREPAVFRARVVDVLCELTGDCVADCGGGQRQMGLVREDDGRLILAAKNIQASFNGAAVDLAPYCGKTVRVDGLLVGDPAVAPVKVYQVHLIRPEGAANWMKAKRWTRIWKRDNPEAAAEKGPWFRNDPAVKAEIEANGWLGLGAEVDRVFIEDNY